MSALATEDMSAVETGPMSAAETEQMSAVETGQMSTVETFLSQQRELDPEGCEGSAARWVQEGALGSSPWGSGGGKEFRGGRGWMGAVA